MFQSERPQVKAPKRNIQANVLKRMITNESFGNERSPATFLKQVILNECSQVKEINQYLNNLIRVTLV